jgi:hypothetical protein
MRKFIIYILIIFAFIFSSIYGCDKGYNPDLGIHVDKKLSFELNSIDSQNLKNNIYSLTKDYYKKGYTSYLFLDRYYNIPKLNDDSEKNDLKDILLEFDNNFKYRDGTFDCDKFSRIFQAFCILSNNDDIIKNEKMLSIGILNFYYTNLHNEKSGHSINILAYLNDKDEIEIRLLEPQLLSTKFLRSYVDTFEEDQKKKDIIFQYAITTIDDYFEDFKDVYIGLMLF